MRVQGVVVLLGLLVAAQGRVRVLLQDQCDAAAAQWHYDDKCYNASK